LPEPVTLAVNICDCPVGRSTDLGETLTEMMCGVGVEFDAEAGFALIELHEASKNRELISVA